jgi:hypothetical protein
MNGATVSIELEPVAAKLIQAGFVGQVIAGTLLVPSEAKEE